ncbi:hypothetical protein KAR91_05595 [Candidatus Pacearchaeota archaeon]|nr:hypothetical protein [Candidatus Pacearchaeota archaeon]
MNLIEAWFHVEREINSKSIAQALRDLNKATGLKVLANKVYEWRDGNARAPDAATYHMRVIVIRHALYMAGMDCDCPSDNQLMTVIQMLSPPLRAPYIKGDQNV